MEIAKVTDHKEYVRDLNTNAVLTVDATAKERHEKIMYQINKEKHVQEQINNLNDDVSEIKQMLKELIGRGS
jgi:hypothetical protein